MSSLTLGILLGLVGGLGLAAIVYAFAPAGLPHLGEAMDRISPHRASPATVVDSQHLPWIEQLGNWGQRYLASLPGFKIPTVDLRLLDKSGGWFVGRKLVAAAFGLLLPTLFSAVLLLLGMQLPFAVPTVVAIALAALFWFVPDLEVAGKAQEARDEYGTAVTAFIELVHLEKLAGLDAGQALKEAAQVGNSRIFKRLAEELQRADWERVPPWRALHTLADELQLPELADLAEIMTAAGEEGVAVADTLQARARDLRNAQLAKEQAKAEAATERMTGPQSALALVFCLMLITPPMLRIFTSG